VTLAVSSFLANWDGFFWPVHVLFSPQSLALQLGLKILQGAYTTDYTVVMARGLLASNLVLILYMFAQRCIFRGVSRSGLKG
jgi:multiple sugar transport system permease protein